MVRCTGVEAINPHGILRSAVGTDRETRRDGGAYVTLWNQAADVFSAVKASQTALSAHWVAALLSAGLGSLFATASSVVGGMPVTRVSVLRDDTTGGHRQALERYLEQPAVELSRWLVGRVICTSVTAALIGDAIHHTWPAASIPGAVVGTLLTYGLFSEVFCSLARRSPERSAPWVMRILRPFELLTIPFAIPLSAVARGGALDCGGAPLDGRTTEHEVEPCGRRPEAGTLGESGPNDPVLN
jgi:hypothetical protein